MATPFHSVGGLIIDSHSISTHCSVNSPEPKPSLDLLDELPHSRALDRRHQHHLVWARKACLVHADTDPLLKNMRREEKY